MGVNSIPFKYMVNEGPSTSVVFTLLVGKQIDTEGAVKQLFGTEHGLNSTGKHSSVPPKVLRVNKRCYL